jgi:hypothetical protein
MEINIGKTGNFGTRREAQIQNSCSMFVKPATNTVGKNETSIFTIVMVAIIFTILTIYIHSD